MWTEQQLRDMPVGNLVYENQWEITRVPNGWIYSQTEYIYNQESGMNTNVHTTSCFVPEYISGDIQLPLPWRKNNA